jgi:hypothetical protein
VVELRVMKMVEHDSSFHDDSNVNDEGDDDKFETA